MLIRIRPKHCLNLKPIARRAQNKGALIVEMGICLPLLVWLTFAIIEYGLVINTTVTLSQLARDTARFTAVHGGEKTADAPAYDIKDATSSTASIRNFLKTECAGTSINYSDLTVVVGALDATNSTVAANVAANRTRGSAITVQLSYDLSKKISVSSQLVPGLATFKSGAYIKRSTILLEKDPQ